MAPGHPVHAVECLQKDTIERMADDIGQIKTALLGGFGGDGGFIGRVRAVESWRAQMEAEAAAKRESSKWYHRAVIGAIIAVVCKDLAIPLVSWALEAMKHQ